MQVDYKRGSLSNIQQRKMSADLIAKAEEYSKLYYDVLLKDVVPFWLKNSLDTKYGGYFTCLDRDGKVFETDKFMWLQGREVYMFSKLYVELKDPYPTEAEEWLKAAKLGADFLKQHGSDSNGRFYFSVTRKGEPIVQPYSIFSDCFAAIAFGAYFMASGEQWAKELTKKIYANIQAIKSNPKGQYNKLFPGTRDLTGLSLPMIDLNLSLELLHLIPEEKEMFTKRAVDNINYIMNTFVDNKRNLLRENVFIGERKDSEDDPMDHFEGRVVNPGHVLEALWFLMTAAHDLKHTGLIDSDKLIAQCGSIMLSTLEFGWDKQHGGIFYFLDVDNKPTQQLEWDQKLWWVHFEALYAVAFAFYLTEKEEFAQWYHKLHEYLWTKFYDPPHGEFWGYLNRRGEVLLELKGGKWKGFFHVPRALLLLAQVFEKIQKIPKNN